MNDGEKAMVAREVPEGWHNLAIGEPGFIQEVFQDFWPDHVSIGRHRMTYPEPRGWAYLRSELGAYLGDDYDGYVVLTNGAKQGLLAAMYAAGKVRGCDFAYAPKPHFPSFPTLANRIGLVWDENLEMVDARGGHVEILTWPNNPSGEDPTLKDKIRQPKAINTFRIEDAVYQSGIYGWEGGRVVDPDAVVNSFSKRYGLSGLRFGWVTFKDPELAEAAAEYVETTTSGVSLMSQLYANSVLEKIRDNVEHFQRLQDEAAQVLCGNASLLRQALGPILVGLVEPIWNGGLFAWFRTTCTDFAARLEVAKVIMVDGTHCGMPGYWRANVGLTATAMMKACAALAPVMRGKYGGIPGVVK